MSETYTALAGDRQSLIPGLGCSVLLHGGVGFTWLLVTLVMANCGPRKPIIDLDDAMDVSLVAASDLKLPERASRAPVPKGAPDPTPEPVPAPPVESDLSYETPDAKPENEGQDVDVDAALEALERQQMLEDLMNAPDGPVNRQATDPNGTGDVTYNPGGANPGDPEYVRYLKKIEGIFNEHFRPLQSIKEANPNAVCKVVIRVDPDSMAVTSYEIYESSGIPAFDAAAERAAAAVPTLPPPPEKYRAMLEQGYVVNFRAR